MFFKNRLNLSGGKSLLTIAIACAAALSLYTIAGTNALNSMQAETTVTPYEFHMDIYNFQTNSQGRLWVRETKARQSDGAKALLEEIFKPAGEVTGRKVTLADGTIVNLVDGIDAKTTCRLKSSKEAAHTMAMLDNPPKSCVFAPDEKLLGYGTLLGQTVAIVITRLDSDETMTAWRSPDLGCLDLKYQVKEKQPDGSMKLITDARPISLSLKEPSPSLFDTGSSYTELLASQRTREAMQRLGRPWTQNDQQTYARMDRDHNAMCQP